MQSIKILYNNFLNVIKFAQLTWQKFHRISQEKNCLEIFIKVFGLLMRHKCCVTFEILPASAADKLFSDRGFHVSHVSTWGWIAA